MQIKVRDILYPITTLGPGNRLVIRITGCSKQCEKCANPELWYPDPAYNVHARELARYIKEVMGSSVVDGITITGGDPLEQITELNMLLREISSLSSDVLVFTGYSIEECRNTLPKEEFVALSQQVSVLVTGRYIDDLNDGKCPLRGSSNQEIIYFDESFKELYQQYLNRKRTIQNVFINDKVISIGIHSKEQETRYETEM